MLDNLLFPKPDLSPLGLSSSCLDDGGYIAAVPSATANTKGSWNQVIASTPVQARSMLIQIFYNPASATPALTGLLDIGIGGAGSEVVLIPNLSFGAAAQFDSEWVRLLIPISVPAGSRLSIRSQVNATSATDSHPTFQMLLFPQGIGANGIDSLNASTANSMGTADTPTNGSKGSYAQLIASTARAYKGIFFIFDNQNTARAGNYCTIVRDFATGAAASEVIFVPDYAYASWNSVFNQGLATSYFPFNIPAGTRIATRSRAFETCNAQGVSAYGVY